MLLAERNLPERAAIRDCECDTQSRAPGTSLAEAAARAKAVVWHNGAITDLNTVVSADTSLILLTAFMINDAGQVVGFGPDLNTFEVHGFLATPLAADAAPAARGPVKLLILPSGANKQLQHRRIF